MRSRPGITGLFIQRIIVIEPTLLKHTDPLAQVSGFVVVAVDCLFDRFDFFSSQSPADLAAWADCMQSHVKA